MCSAEQPIGQFQKRRDATDGLSPSCKPCLSKRRTELRLQNDKAYRDGLAKKRNVAHLAQMGLKCCSKCGVAKEASGEFFYKNAKAADGLHWVCKECDRSRLVAAYKKDPKPFRLKRREYVQGNKEKVNASARRWKKSSPVVALSIRVRDLVRQALRSKGYTKSSRTHEILGCDWQDFAQHIERQFLKGMSWDNRSEWHLDHIVPLATAKSEKDVIRLSHFTNIRPLWAADNLRKNATITHLI